MSNDQRSPIRLTQRATGQGSSFNNVEFVIEFPYQSSATSYLVAF